jgi:hypothetical protein
VIHTCLLSPPPHVLLVCFFTVLTPINIVDILYFLVLPPQIFPQLTNMPSFAFLDFFDIASQCGSIRALVTTKNRISDASIVTEHGETIAWTFYVHLRTEIIRVSVTHFRNIYTLKLRLQLAIMSKTEVSVTEQGQISFL